VESVIDSEDSYKLTNADLNSSDSTLSSDSPEAGKTDTKKKRTLMILFSAIIIAHTNFIVSYLWCNKFLSYDKNTLIEIISNSSNFLYIYNKPVK
jgi:hypothetical protein